MSCFSTKADSENKELECCEKCSISCSSCFSCFRRKRVEEYKLSTPFHLSIPVHNLDEARKFYGVLLGMKEGRSSD